MSVFTHGSNGLSTMQDRNNPFLPPRSTYSYPLLKSEEIAKCLAELGINVTLDDLQNPDKNKDSIRRLLEGLADVCTGIGREELQQPTFSGLQFISFPELHDDSVTTVNLFRACSRMMDVCEIPDFSIKDLMAPTASRLRRHLSGIINFAKFREERLMLLADLRTKRESLLGKLASVTDRSETLHTRLSLLREQTKEESMTILSTEADCQSISTEITAMRIEEERMRKELEQLQSTLHGLVEELKLKASKSEVVLKERVSLSAQIVSSPEKFRQQIMEVGQSLQAEQKDGKAAEKKVRELTAWLVNVEESQNEVNTALEAIYELRAEVERQKSVKGDLDAQTAATASERVVFGEMQQQLRQSQRFYSRMEEKLKLLRHQLHTRTAENQSAIEMLHQQLIDAESLRLQITSGVERHESEAVRLEAELGADSISQQQEIRDITSSYQRLEAVVIQHLKNLQRSLSRETAPDTDAVTSERVDDEYATAAGKENMAIRFPVEHTPCGNGSNGKGNQQGQHEYNLTGRSPTALHSQVV